MFSETFSDFSLAGLGFCVTFAIENKKFNNKKIYDNETEFRIYNKADKR